MVHWDVARCMVQGVRCMLARCALHAGCCAMHLHRAPVRHARGQRYDGGVLSISGGSATFESVEISDTSAGYTVISNTTAAVRLAGKADRAGGRLGRRCAEWWHGDDGWRVSLLQGRQHRTLFGGARSSSLTVARVAWSCMGCLLRCIVCCSCCHVCCARCTYV
jgi:hypothetical protein